MPPPLLKYNTACRHAICWDMRYRETDVLHPLEISLLCQQQLRKVPGRPEDPRRRKLWHSKTYQSILLKGHWQIPTIKMINFACGFFDQDNDRWYQRPFNEPEGGGIKKAQKYKAWFRSKIPKLAKTCQNPKLNKLRLSTSQAQNKIIKVMFSRLQATHIEGATAPWECSIDATRQHEKHTSFTSSPPDRFYWGKSCHCVYLEDLQSTSHNKSPTACDGIPPKFSISVWLFDDDLCGLVTSKLCLPAPEMSSPVPTPKLAVAKRPPDT